MLEVESYDQNSNYTDVVKREIGSSAFKLVNKLLDTDFEYRRGFIRNSEDLIPCSRAGKEELNELLESTELDYDLIGD